MRKEELIERIEDFPCEASLVTEMIRINKNTLLGWVKELDEPQKVTIPQFVADYIDFKKTYDFHVYGAMRVIEDHYDKRVQEWFYEDNVEKFCLAWLDGYEVEKEKRYIVKMKGMDKDFTILKLDKIRGSWYLGEGTEYSYTKTAHTRKELEEAGFGEVFNSPLFEVEEVTE